MHYPKPGSGHSFQKDTARGSRGVKTLDPPEPIAVRHRNWSLCTCDDEDKHDRGCPVHLAWLTSYAAHKGVPDIRGLSLNATDLFEVCWLGAAQFRAGAKRYLYSPGRERLANVIGALRKETREKAPDENRRGFCALETVSRALTQLKEARCVTSGRKVMQFVQRRRPKTALLLIEEWVVDLPKGAVLRVALPGDYDYPDPLKPLVVRDVGINVSDDSRDIEHLYDLAPDRKSGPEDLTSEWAEDRAFDLTVSFLSMPYVAEARDELGTGGRGLAQWFRNQCDLWRRQGKTTADVRRALYACLSYVGTGKVRNGWCALLVAAVKGRWSSQAKNQHDVDYWDHFQRGAIVGVRAIREGHELLDLTPLQQDAVLEVLRWLKDTGTAAMSEAAMIRRAGMPAGRAGSPEGSAF